MTPISTLCHRALSFLQPAVGTAARRPARPPGSLIDPQRMTFRQAMIALDKHGRQVTFGDEARLQVIVNRESLLGPSLRPDAANLTALLRPSRGFSAMLEDVRVARAALPSPYAASLPQLQQMNLLHDLNSALTASKAYWNERFLLAYETGNATEQEIATNLISGSRIADALFRGYDRSAAPTSAAATITAPHAPSAAPRVEATRTPRGEITWDTLVLEHTGQYNTSYR